MVVGMTLSRRLRVRQWSRAAWALAVLFASLPVASRVFLGRWGFDAATEMAAICGVLGAWLHILGRRRARPDPDPAHELDLAMEMARAGRLEEAIGRLSETIRVNPHLWQAFQYRGELYLLRPETCLQAIRDFEEALRLMPEEPHLYQLRDYARNLAAGLVGPEDQRQSSST